MIISRPTTVLNFPFAPGLYLEVMGHQIRKTPVVIGYVLDEDLRYAPVYGDEPEVALELELRIVELEKGALESLVAQLNRWSHRPHA